MEIYQLLVIINSDIIIHNSLTINCYLFDIRYSFFNKLYIKQTKILFPYNISGTCYPANASRLHKQSGMLTI